MDVLWAALLGYALGSIPFGLIVARLGGAGDIRAIGSGNIGATNVLRTGRKGLAAATLLLDGGKGAAAVWIAWATLINFDGNALGDRWVMLLCLPVAGLAALLGHCFPVWLGFRGGKGVATLLGVNLAMDWRTGLVCIAVWAIAARLTRISSVAGMASAIAAPVWVLVPLALHVAINVPGAVLNPGIGVLFVRPAALALMALLVIYQHRANIARLRAGTEPRIGQKSTPEA